MKVPALELRRRITSLLLGSVVMIMILVGRLAWIQFVQGEQLRAEAVDLRMRDIQVEARRGTIFDRRGRELAISVNVDSIYAVPAEIQDPQSVALALTSALNLSYEDALERVTRRASFSWVQRKVDDDRSRMVRELDLPGIHFTIESRRYYPKGDLASHLLGFSGIDNQGLEGLEYAFDSGLKGEPGRIVVEFDARGREIPEAVHYFIPPDDGNHLVLALDEVVQYVVERELEAAVIEHGAKGGIIVAMHPSTGDILGMASYPSFDLNRWTEYPASRWRNPIVSDSYHPGSVFKPFLASASIDLGIFTPDSGFYDPGSFRVPGATIKNWDGSGLGSTSLRQGLWYSANVVMAQIALQIGRDGVYQYLDAFGFTQPTGIKLPGEATGIFPAKEESRPVDLAVMSYGQTLQVTAIQMITAMNAYLNDGVLIQPRVALGYVDDDGEWLEQFPVVRVRQAVSPTTAEQMREILVEVVEKGSGTQAQIAGYTVGGKTGTSQKTIGGRVSEDQYIGSFMGFLPAHDPELIIYVVIDEPQSMPWGGWVAAPAFAKIVRDLVHYLEIPPDVPVDDEDEPAGPVPLVTVPNLVNLPQVEAATALREAGLILGASGDAGVVVSQVPPAGARVEAGSTVAVAFEAGTGSDEGESVVIVPDLSGMALRRAAEVLAAQGLRMSFSGSGLVTGQDPEPGQELARGQTVRIELSQPLEGR